MLIYFVIFALAATILFMAQAGTKQQGVENNVQDGEAGEYGPIHFVSRINPANGLPLVGNGAFDIHGNPNGHASGVNPANGLPLVGDGAFDILGNPHGFSSFD
ncbi:hypothetical protein [Burkholderia sp. BCC1998]|uniref:hypothetical protein n=1 Tax=Burkholderia sp. BCC1998 TaxID=2817447 RepID=UPI002AB7A537|nr:hypothetical protein [Burkholderia sp. BCC1998]